MMEIRRSIFLESKVLFRENMATTGSLWSQVRELEGDALRQIQSLYDTNFPIEFRHYFAEVIERQPWDQIDPDNTTDEGQAKFILDNFLTEITRQCELLSDGGDFLQRLRFTEIGQHFRNVYGNHPMELVRTVKKILQIETRLVQEARNGVTAEGQEDVKPANTGSGEKIAQINKELENLNTMTQDAESDLRKLQSKQEYFVINYQESVKIQSSLQQIQVHIKSTNINCNQIYYLSKCRRLTRQDHS